jgi:hypothetical protein
MLAGFPSAAAFLNTDAQLVGQMVKVLRLGVVRDLLCMLLAELLLRQSSLRDFQQRVLGEMADQAGGRAVLDYRRRSGLGPSGDHPPQIHVAPVEGSLGRVFVVGARVRIPQLYRRVHIQHAPVVAPMHDFAGVDVPGQVDEEVSVGEMLAQQAPQVLRRPRSLMKVTRCSIQGFKAASFGSKSMMVMRLGSTLRCLIKIGSVQRATAPKPTNKTRLGMQSSLFFSTTATGAKAGQQNHAADRQINPLRVVSSVKREAPKVLLA